jgi:hypothetical protein
VEGKDEKSWHLKVTADPGTDVASWAALVTDITKMGLAEAASEGDIMKLFTNNRIVFEKLKAEDEASYTALMLDFKNRKEELKG